MTPAAAMTAVMAVAFIVVIIPLAFRNERTRICC
jgi:hypothetical protein